MRALQQTLLLLWLVSIPIHTFASDPCEKDEVTPDATAACSVQRLNEDKQAVMIEYKKLLSLLPQKPDETSEIAPSATKSWLRNAQTAWTKSVDINCEFGPAISGGEFHYVMARANSCRQKEYKRRTTQLRNWRSCIQGDASQCP
ncbi:lysozyme inhibitor LprI family protein [Sulfuriferula multivorans]|uniref:lysozyme inhibitor LprI family protein n=1 Tax=Sulfuriferula multivorans TaxID=1559896 RepID=UPI000F5BA965|nr:lysozyme inhibitor LprI family protein [Sulfuriferula multivorans]